MLFLSRLHLSPVLLLVLTVAGWGEPVVLWPIPQPPSDTPVECFPLPRLDAQKRFQGNLEQASQGPVDLVFDGEACTDFWRTQGKAVWQERYGALNAVNFGIDRDRVENMLWRVTHGEFEGLHPKLIVLMVGTNNLRSDSAQTIAEGIKALVSEDRKHCPEAHILLLGTFPCAEKNNDPLRSKITEINRIISKLDDGKKVSFLDIGAKFLQPDGTISREVMSDFTHPTEKGYRIWADAIQPVIQQYCPRAEVSPAASSPIANRGTASGSEVVTWPWPLPPPETPVTTFPVPRNEWFLRFTENLDKLKSGPYDLVFDGDSITDKWQLPDRGLGVWREHYGSLKALDIAISGDGTQHVLWRLQHGALDGQNPKLIVLMIGTNNVGGSPAHIAAAIKKILNEYETRCPNAHILLLGLLPRGAQAKTPLRDWISKINAILATFDDGRKVTFLDMGTKFLQPDGTLSAEIMPDFLHPSAKGYSIWAAAIQPVIDQHFPQPAEK